MSFLTRTVYILQKNLNTNYSILITHYSILITYSNLFGINNFGFCGGKPDSGSFGSFENRVGKGFKT